MSHGVRAGEGHRFQMVSRRVSSGGERGMPKTGRAGEEEADLSVRHGVHVGLVEVTIGVHLLDLLGMLGTDRLRLVAALREIRVSNTAAITT